MHSKFEFLRNLILILILPAIPALGQAPDPLDCEQVLQRMQKSAALREDQVRAIRPIVLNRCGSLQKMQERSQGSGAAGAEALRKELEESSRGFREAVSGHLDAGQLPSIQRFLDEWDLEFIHAATGAAPQASTAKKAGGARISLSVTPPGFEESPGAAMVQLSELKTDTSDPSAGADGTAKRGEFAIAPYPLVNPTIGNGIVLVGAYIRRLSATDKVSPPSVFGLGGMYTSSNSWAAGYGQKLFLKQDRYRLLSGLGYLQLNYDFSIGTVGNKDLDLPIHQKGYGFLAGGQVRTFRRWYLGMRYHYMMVKTTVDLNELLPGLPVDIKPYTLDINMAGLMAQIERDTRDNQFYPRRGSVIDLRGDFNEKDLGGDYNYQRYEVSHQGYYSFGTRHILAYSASGCAVKGNVPFFAQCMLGQSSDLRGYALGKHQNRRMLVGQAEYRLDLPWRFGLVGFFGAGEVARKWEDFNTENILPGGGLGLRFLLAKMNHINVRVDYAWGKGSQTWYVGLGEAF